MSTIEVDPIEFLTRKESADLLRICTRLIDDAIADGSLRACRVGQRRIVIERGELLRWARGASQGAAR